MEPKSELVRIDAGGVARPIGNTAGQRLRARAGAYRLMPAPSHVVFMRHVGEDGQRDETDGAVVRLAGEVTHPGTLCDIVALVAQAGWRGELVVLDGQTSRSIFFEAGNVIAAQSSAEGERVGEVMYKLGALTQEQVEQIAAAVTEGRRFGEAAIELGLLPRERVFDLMGKQAEEIVYASLLVGDGMFWFLDGFDETRLSATHHISANAILMEGVRRMDEVKYFRERIPSDEHVPVRVPGRTEPPAELAQVLAACDGRRSVMEVGRACGLPEFEATHAVFRLVQAGFLHIQPPLPTSVEAIVAIFNDAIRAIYESLDRAGKSDSLRSQMSMYSSTAGVYDALFSGAGPAGDGTLKEARIAKNMDLMGVDDPQPALAEWLYDYVSYAMFNASAGLTKENEQALAKRVHDRLALLAAKSARSMRATSTRSDAAATDPQLRLTDPPDDI